jgi:hypothetical protein
MIRALVIALCLTGLSVRAADYTGSFTTSYGQKLGPEDSESSLTFEPLVQVPIDDKNGLEFGTVVNRPLDPYRNFQVPRTAAIYLHDFGPLSGVASVNALDIDRWSLDGAKVRLTTSAEYEQALAPWLTLTLRAGPFVQANRYAQDAAGREHPRWGFTEVAKLVGTAGDFRFDVRVVVSQLEAGVWHNDYATLQRGPL